MMTKTNSYVRRSIYNHTTVWAVVYYTPEADTIEVARYESEDAAKAASNQLGAIGIAAWLQQNPRGNYKTWLHISSHAYDVRFLSDNSLIISFSNFKKAWDYQRGYEEQLQQKQEPQMQAAASVASAPKLLPYDPDIQIWQKRHSDGNFQHWNDNILQMDLSGIAKGDLLGVLRSASPQELLMALVNHIEVKTGHYIGLYKMPDSVYQGIMDLIYYSTIGQHENKSDDVDDPGVQDDETGTTFVISFLDTIIDELKARPLIRGAMVNQQNYPHKIGLTIVFESQVGDQQFGSWEEEIQNIWNLIELHAPDALERVELSFHITEEGIRDVSRTSARTQGSLPGAV